jgi:hypothetical protein
MDEVWGVMVGIWGDGRICNPEDGRSYASNIALLNPNTLEVNGCVLLFCKRQVWRRFDFAQCPPVANTIERTAHSLLR